MIQPDQRPRRRWPRVLLGTLLVVVLAAGAASLAGWWLLQAPGQSSQPQEFEVMPGWGATRIADELAEAGLVRNARAFGLYLRWQDLDRSVGEGLYDLDPAFTAAETAAVLEAGGRPRVTRVVIPEGFRAAAVVERLVEAGFGSIDDYAQLAGEVQREWLEAQPAPEGDNRPLHRLEGYLFPASYDIPVHSTPGQALAQFLDRFEQELQEEHALARLEELGLSVHDWVTLASLVQAEAGSDAEMPIIAGVFLNRLDEGMPLQSDPTVAYGLDKTLPELDAPAGDMAADHPWNTYVYAELPAGPIGNPGHQALAAVLEPQRTNEAGDSWYYFLHGTLDGQPVFRPNTNYAAHLRDIEEYLR